MSLRWRLNGDLVCAATTSPEDGDTYINDRLHYQLSAISKAIVADADHESNDLWHWVHGKEWLRAIPEEKREERD